MIAIAVIAISGSSGGAGGHAAAPSADSRALAVNGPRVPPENCPSVRKALRYYTAQYLHWTGLRVGAAQQYRGPLADGTRCPRYLMHVRKAKARAAHRAWNAYFHYHYAWSEWMPEKLQRVGACETGYGKRPGNFHWDSGLYVSFAGIIRDGYATFAHRLGLRSWDESRSELGRDPTPREQVLVTLALQRAYGWGAWGCGGA